MGAGRGAKPAPVAARRKVRAAGWEARAELLKWSKSKAWRGWEGLFMLRGNAS